MPRRLMLVGGIAALSLLGACYGVDKISAQKLNTLDSLNIWTYTGNPLTYPVTLTTVYPTTGHPAVQPYLAGIPTFDIVFDIDSVGKAVFIPMKLVERSNGQFREIGFQLTDSAFDSIRVAPLTGYETDSAIAVDTGHVVLVQANSYACLGGISTKIYSKIVIDTIDAPGRRLKFHMVSDPNCAFRGLVPDSLPPN